GVISRDATQEKFAFGSSYTYPVFAILDPETTYSLPPRQVANGIVDAFVHVVEQYLTYPVNAPLQDRQAEAVMITLIEEGPKALADPTNYDARATLMWCATQALNGLIGCGVPQDWATHMIGHELTALYGLDHAQTLAIVLPAVMRHQRARKCEKLLQYAERVWGVRSGSDDFRIDAAIKMTELFFRSVGVPTTLHEYGMGAEVSERIRQRFEQRSTRLGEHQDIGAAETAALLATCI
ncbi:MAG: iron-containing alcohol dehydrogenase, partial [Chloroflexi bacterium]|nr:iron-containing alcohol dehydrogenase [Chloroflexota bacterium]